MGTCASSNQCDEANRNMESHDCKIDIESAWRRSFVNDFTQPLE